MRAHPGRAPKHTLVAQEVGARSHSPPAAACAAHGAPGRTPGVLSTVSALKPARWGGSVWVVIGRATAHGLTCCASGRAPGRSLRQLKKEIQERLQEPEAPVGVAPGAASQDSTAAGADAAGAGDEARLSLPVPWSTMTAPTLKASSVTCCSSAMHAGTLEMRDALQPVRARSERRCGRRVPHACLKTPHHAWAAVRPLCGLCALDGCDSCCARNRRRRAARRRPRSCAARWARWRWARAGRCAGCRSRPGATRASATTARRTSAPAACCCAACPRPRAPTSASRTRRPAAASNLLARLRSACCTRSAADAELFKSRRGAALGAWCRSGCAGFASRVRGRAGQARRGSTGNSRRAAANG